VLSFSGTKDQVIYFASVSRSGFANSPPTWRLIDPFGHRLFGSDENFDTDQPNIRLPASGTYFLLIEGRRNESAAAGTVTFDAHLVPQRPAVPLGQQATAADLKVSAITTTPATGLHAGSVFTVNWTDLNAGTVATAGGWADRVVLRNVATNQVIFDQSLVYDPAVDGNIGPNESRNRQIQVTLPLDARGAGDISITVTVDSGNDVAEQNNSGDAEANNATSVTINSRPSPAVSAALQAGSDTGSSSADRRTSDNTPTFDVTVNQAGTITLDVNGDGAAEVTVNAGAAGTFEVTSPVLVDGARTLSFGFTSDLNQSATTSVNVTIDTAGPILLAAGATAVSPVSSFKLTFNEAIDPGTLTTADVTLMGPGGLPIAVTGVSGSGTTFTVTFATQSAPGAYSITVGPNVADLAGNLMDQDADGTGGEAGADVGRDAVLVTADVTAPFVVGQAPVGAVNTNVSKVRLTFSEPIDGGSFTAADVLMTGPGGPVAGSSITVTQVDAVTFDVGFPTQTAEGDYSLTVGPDILDLAGNAMGKGTAVTVYSSDFEAGGTAPWSNTSVDTTPGTAAHPSTRYLGQFGNGTVRLTLPASQFPANTTSVALSLDLFILGSWDGNFTNDTFKIDVLGGATLLNTSFSNNAGEAPFDRQAFPGTVGADNPARSGASENNTLGFLFQGAVRDSVYRFADAGALTFNYSPSLGDLVLEFTSTQDGPISNDESWGVDNVQVVATGGGSAAGYTGGFTIDKTPPKVVTAGPASLLTPLSSIDVTFTEAIDAGTFTAGDVSLTGPNGGIGVSSVTMVSPTVYRVSFSPQTAGGTYNFSIGPNISDAAGNLMDQDGNGTGGQPGDKFTSSFSIDVSHADLVVEAVSAAAVTTPLQSGDPINVSWRVRNVGNAATGGGTWVDRIVYSADGVLDAGDIEIGRVVRSGPLAKDAAYTTSATVNLPNGVSGSFHVFVVTDATNTVFEDVFENNNTGRTVEALSVTVSWSVTNAGVGAAKGPWTDQVFFSTDGTLANAVEVGSAQHFSDVAAGGSYSASVDVILPIVADGNYRIIIVTDAGNVVFEGTNEGNNSAAGDPALALTHPDLSAAITASPATAVSDTTVGIDWQITNVGSGAAGGTWLDRLYLSDNATFDAGDMLLGEVAHAGPLAANGQYSAHLDFHIPVGASGAKFFILRTDAGDVVIEPNGEVNNTAMAGIAIQLAPFADLQTSDVSFVAGFDDHGQPVAIGDPAQVSVSWTVTNKGTGAGSTAEWVDTVVASRNAIAGDGDDVVLGQFAHSGALAVDGSYSQTQNLTLPPGFQGRFHLFVRSDAQDVVFENNSEANNAGEAPKLLDVVPIPYADLTVSDVVADAAGMSGQPLTVSWNVTNQGIGITNTASWSDTVLLATDAAGTNIVATLGTLDHKGVLAVGGGYSRTAQVTLPNGLTGTFFVVVRTSGPFEFVYTTNNSAVSGAVGVTLTVPPDLTVDDITAPTSAMAGQKIDIAWTIRNAGAGDAGGTWTDSIFLRQAGNPNAPLLGLGTFAYNAGLQAGKFYTRSEQFTLPTTLQGLFQVVVKTNTSNSLFENGLTGNNSLDDNSTLLVSLPVKPDLQVQSVTIPSSVSAGGTIAVDFTIIYQGTTQASGKWKDNVYLSLDNQISGDDLLIGSLDNGAALDSGESYRTLTGGLLIPKRYRGAVFVIVQADG
jgi:hypothetical protein